MKYFPFRTLSTIFYKIAFEYNFELLLLVFLVVRKL